MSIMLITLIVKITTLTAVLDIFIVIRVYLGALVQYVILKKPKVYYTTMMMIMLIYRQNLF